MEKNTKDLVNEMAFDFKYAYRKFFTIWKNAFIFLFPLGFFAIFVFPIVVIVGTIAMVLLPIIYIIIFLIRFAQLRGKRKSNNKFIGTSIIGFLCCLIAACLIISGVCIILKPVLIFQNWHFSFVIIMTAVIGVITVSFALLTMLLFSKAYFESVNALGKRKIVLAKGCLSIIGVILAIALMCIGFYKIPSKDYDISNTKEFNILYNMPFAGKCNFQIVSDLDFNGESSKGWSGISYFYGVLDGNGHVIKNLHFEGNAKKTNQTEFRDSFLNYYCDGLVGINYGTIKDINFVDCQFKVIYAESQNVEDAYLGILVGENGGTVQDCSITNCFIEYKLKNGKRQSAVKYNVGILIGSNDAYKEGYHWEDKPAIIGTSINNTISITKDFVADKGYIMVK